MQARPAPAPLTAPPALVSPALRRRSFRQLFSDALIRRLLLSLAVVISLDLLTTLAALQHGDTEGNLLGRFIAVHQGYLGLALGKAFEIVGAATIITFIRRWLAIVGLVFGVIVTGIAVVTNWLLVIGNTPA